MQYGGKETIYGRDYDIDKHPIQGTVAFDFMCVNSPFTPGYVYWIYHAGMVELKHTYIVHVNTFIKYWIFVPKGLPETSGAYALPHSLDRSMAAY